MVDSGQVFAMQAAVEAVEIDTAVASYLVDVVRNTREAGGVQLGRPERFCRPAAGLFARAAIAGRSFVLPDDVKAMAVPCLAHRVALRPELSLRGVQASEIVQRCLATIPVPVGWSDGPQTPGEAALPDALADPATWSGRIAGSTIALVTASSLSLLAAVVTGDWVLVVLAAPLALAGVLGLTGKPPPLPEVHTSIEPLLLSTSSTFTVEIVATSGVPTDPQSQSPHPARTCGSDDPCRWDVYLRAWCQ